MPSMPSATRPAWPRGCRRRCASFTWWTWAGCRWGPELAIDLETLAKARRGSGEKILAAARAAARAAGVEAEAALVETATPTQHIAAAIADEAARWPADVVVLGTHGRRAVERLLLGSVAEGVARHSTVPVLLVPLPAAGR